MRSPFGFLSFGAALSSPICCRKSVIACFTAICSEPCAKQTRASNARDANTRSWISLFLAGFMNAVCAFNTSLLFKHGLARILLARGRQIKTKAISSGPSPRHFFIHLGIFLCRPLPPIIPRHPIPHQLFPAFFILKRRQRPVDSLQQPRCFQPLKLEPRSRSQLRIPLLDRVVQPSGRAHHRRRPVLE